MGYELNDEFLLESQKSVRVTYVQQLISRITKLGSDELFGLIIFSSLLILPLIGMLLILILAIFADLIHTG